MSNWKNVNNWHWVNKNCKKWAETYFNEELVGVEGNIEGKDYPVVKIEKVVSVEGDVDLNQRKGKIITIYDIALKLDWKATLADETDETGVTGSLFIPEIAHDTDSDDYVFSIEIKGNNVVNEDIKKIIRKSLQPQLIKKFAELPSRMIKENCEDVYIEQEKMGNATPPRAATDTKNSSSTVNKEVAPTSTIVKHKTVVNTTSITEEKEFQVSPQNLFEVFTVADKCRMWTRSNVKLTLEVGSDFSLFDGNVTGKILELVPNTKLVQTWRLKSWPENHYSEVTFDFIDSKSYTTVKMTQTGVPVGEEATLRDKWDMYYWRNIGAMFGAFGI